jgi:predicted TIM-barrel fold metal-dependent hydrolase
LLAEPQLPDLIDLARAFPETAIVLNHVGMPLGLASYAGKREERFPIWRDNIRELAKSPKVFVKLGGLANVFSGFPSFMADPPAPSSQLAAEWKPYFETCIDAFGPQRCKPARTAYSTSSMAAPGSRREAFRSPCPMPECSWKNSGASRS